MRFFELLIFLLLFAFAILDKARGKPTRNHNTILLPDDLLIRLKKRNADSSYGYLEQCGKIEFPNVQRGVANVVGFLDSSWPYSHRQAMMLKILNERLRRTGLPETRFFVINVESSSRKIDDELIMEDTTEREQWLKVAPDEIETFSEIEKTFDSLARIVHPDIEIIQDNESLGIWKNLRGSRDQVLVIDRCGKLTYQVIVPWSILHFPYVKAAILSTHLDEPCGTCEIVDDGQADTTDNHGKSTSTESFIENDGKTKNTEFYDNSEMEKMMGEPTNATESPYPYTFSNAHIEPVDSTTSSGRNLISSTDSRTTMQPGAIKSYTEQTAFEEATTNPSDDNERDYHKFEDGKTSIFSTTFAGTFPGLETTLVYQKVVDATAADEIEKVTETNSEETSTIASIHEESHTKRIYEFSESEIRNSTSNYPNAPTGSPEETTDFGATIFETSEFQDATPHLANQSTVIDYETTTSDNIGNLFDSTTETVKMSNLSTTYSYQIPDKPWDTRVEENSSSSAQKIAINAKHMNSDKILVQPELPTVTPILPTEQSLDHEDDSTSNKKPTSVSDTFPTDYTTQITKEKFDSVEDSTELNTKDGEMLSTTLAPAINSNWGENLETTEENSEFYTTEILAISRDAMSLASPRILEDFPNGQGDEEENFAPYMPIRIIMHAPHFHVNVESTKMHEYLVLKTGDLKTHRHLVSYDATRLYSGPQDHHEEPMHEKREEIEDRKWPVENVIYNKDESPGMFGEAADYWKDWGILDYDENNEEDTRRPGDETFDQAIADYDESIKASEELRKQATKTNSEKFPNVDTAADTTDILSGEKIVETTGNPEEDNVEDAILRNEEEKRNNLVSHYSKLLPWIYYVLD